VRRDEPRQFRPVLELQGTVLSALEAED
jgi:hypothetical protein